MKSIGILPLAIVLATPCIIAQDVVLHLSPNTLGANCPVGLSVNHGSSFPSRKTVGPFASPSAPAQVLFHDAERNRVLPLVTPPPPLSRRRWLSVPAVWRRCTRARRSPRCAGLGSRRVATAPPARCSTALLARRHTCWTDSESWPARPDTGVSGSLR